MSRYWHAANVKLAKKAAWWRPYSPGLGRWIIIGWEVGSLALLHRTTVPLYSLGSGGAKALAVALAVLWLVSSWRIVGMGVYVGQYGVRVRGLLRTRTLRWAEIDEFVLDEPDYRFGKLLVPTGITVLIRHRDGTYVNTPLWAKGIDFHRRPRVFRQVYGVLRERHATALAATA